MKSSASMAYLFHACVVKTASNSYLAVNVRRFFIMVYRAQPEREREEHPQAEAGSRRKAHPSWTLLRVLNRQSEGDELADRNRDTDQERCQALDDPAVNQRQNADDEHNSNPDEGRKLREP